MLIFFLNKKMRKKNIKLYNSYKTAGKKAKKIHPSDCKTTWCLSL